MCSECANGENLDLESGLEALGGTSAQSNDVSDTTLDEYGAFAECYVEYVGAKPWSMVFACCRHEKFLMVRTLCFSTSIFCLRSSQAAQMSFGGFI